MEKRQEGEGDEGMERRQKGEGDVRGEDGEEAVGVGDKEKVEAGGQLKMRVTWTPRSRRPMGMRRQQKRKS